MVLAKRFLTLVAGLMALSSLASGYYHYVYFTGRSAPFNPVNMQFDLTTSNTVAYFVSDQSPSVFLAGDSFNAVISEIQLAAQAWNGVATSQIRLAFGGLENASTQQSTPGIDIVFDDNMPPGLLAQTKPMTYSSVFFANNNGTPFVPILRSRIQFRRDLTNQQQASYQDSFFTTIVHEFGHSIGLQHTLTSSVMSTLGSGRSTTKASPLAADDVAGVSLLYPAPGFPGSTGSIVGRVALGGSGVNMANVVAISANGTAVSGIANPDGSYRIDGIPAGQYYVYVSPLPPTLQIQVPLDAAQNPFQAQTRFVTQFFPGTRDWTQATQILVTPGNTVPGVNFNVQQSNGPVVYDLEIFGYQGNSPVASPPVPAGTRAFVAFAAPGLLGSNNQLAPGLNVSVIGGPAQVEAGSIKYYASGFLQMYVNANSVFSTTPTALAVTLNNDLYVLPAAFYVTQTGPPVLSSLTQGADSQGNGILTVAGQNLNSSTRMVFDGAPANLLNVNSDGSLVVSAPQAAGGYHAFVEALNPDGQSSSQALAATGLPPQFFYNSGDAPAINVSSASLIAGTDALIQINGFNTNFVDGQTLVGTGSSDIVVRRVWVVNPGLLLVNLSVAASAPPTAATITVSTGLQMATATLGLQVLAANPKQISLRAPVVNQATGLAGIPAGGTALISTNGLPQNLGGWTLTIGQQQTGFSVGANGQLIAPVPSGLLSGPVIVQLNSPNGDNIPPIVMQVDLPPPVIIGAANSAGVAIDAAHPVRPGDVLALSVAGLANPNASSITVTVGGVNLAAFSVTPNFNQSGVFTVQAVLTANVPMGQVLVTVGVNSSVSAEYPVNIHN